MDDFESVWDAMRTLAQRTENAPGHKHSCQCCAQIAVSDSDSQKYEFSYSDVIQNAGRCELFLHFLLESSSRLPWTARLVLSIDEDDNDFLELRGDWRDEQGESLLEDNAGLTLYIFCRLNTLAAEHIRSTPIERAPGAPHNLQRCLERYKECLNHARCNAFAESNKSDVGPTRLLEIRQNSQPRLYSVHRGECPTYAALSYCWGDTQQQKDGRTTKANFQDRHRGIKISQLPQSIIDAITVTQALELSYLWVDALCIVQDDPEERITEISKMGSIYRGATVTIAAARANDSTAGFLGPRDFCESYGKVFKLPFHKIGTSNRARSSCFISEKPISDIFDEPIDQRAWTMQEDMLSLRLLRFGTKQTTWRCPNELRAIRVDGGGRPEYPTWNSDIAVTEPYRAAEVRSTMSTSGPLGPSDIWSSWMESVERFSKRKVTQPDDRLRACAALAENVAQVMCLKPSNYLAGLWSEDIYVELLWFRSEGTESEKLSRPSWSWVSITGPVEFFPRRFFESNLKVEAVAKYIETNMDHEVDNHGYSEVRSNHLELNGRLRQAYWDSASLKCSIDDTDVLPFEIHWDVSATVRPQSVWCLEIVASFLFLGLVLVTQDQESFERVGVFDCDLDKSAHMEFFNEVEPRTIALY